MSQLRRTPGMTNAGEDWDDARRSAVVTRVVAGTLSIRDAADRYALSPECIRDWVLMFRRSALHTLDDHLRHTLVGQGLCADDLAAAAFAGPLEDLAIADLLQMLDLWRKDGVITIFHDFQESRIWCAGGSLMDAESGKLRGERAVQRILALEHGRVTVDFCLMHRARVIQTSTVALLIDAARRKDECRVLNQRLGENLYRLGSNPMSVSAAFSPGETAVLHAFEAPRSVAGVVAESDCGDLETLTVISALVERGYLVRGGKASIESLVPKTSEEVSSRTFVPTILRQQSARRAQRTASSGGMRLGLAVALGALGIAGWLVPRWLVSSSSTDAGEQAPLHGVPQPPLAIEARAIRVEHDVVGSHEAPESSAFPAAEPAVRALRTPEPEAENSGVPAGDALLARPALSQRQRPPSKPAPPEVPAPRAGEVVPGRTASDVSPSPAPAPLEEPTQPRMQIIEEETPTMRILE